jgi:hypothetical protein
MPWLSVPFEDKRRIDLLYQFFRPRGIPSLVILDSSGNVVSKEGKYDLDSRGKGAFEYWLHLK